MPFWSTVHQPIAPSAFEFTHHANRRMNVAQKCPSRDEWKEFDRGRVQSDRADWLSEHLDTCKACTSIYMNVECSDGDHAVPAVVTAWEHHGSHDGELAALIHQVLTSSCDSKLDSAIRIELPHEIGRFELVRLLGKGDFGRVYLAQEQELERQVAIKILSKGALSGDELKRFRQEAKAAATLNHTNIVPLIDFGFEVIVGGATRLYLIYKLVDGGITLREWMATSNNQRDPKVAASLCRDVSDAMVEAHRHQIVHCGLNPENILVDSAGTPYVTDFGMAKIKNFNLTKKGAIVGTLAYTSPEQVNGTVAPQCDIFSIGVILFELLAGRTPVAGKDPFNLLSQLFTGRHPSLVQIAPDTPIDLATISEKCRESNPRERYESADELRDDLDRFLRGEPIGADQLGR